MKMAIFSKNDEKMLMRKSKNCSLYIYQMVKILRLSKNGVSVDYEKI